MYLISVVLNKATIPLILHNNFPWRLKSFRNFKGFKYLLEIRYTNTKITEIPNLTGASIFIDTYICNIPVWSNY